MKQIIGKVKVSLNLHNSLFSEEVLSCQSKWENTSGIHSHELLFT